MSLRGRGAPLEGLLSPTARESGAPDVAARAAGPRRPVSPRPLPACAPRSQSAAGSQAGRARSPRRGRSCGRATPGEAEARPQVTPWPRRAPPAAQTPPRPLGPETARPAPRPLTVVGSPAPRLRDDARAAPPAPATPAPLAARPRADPAQARPRLGGPAPAGPGSGSPGPLPERPGAASAPPYGSASASQGSSERGPRTQGLGAIETQREAEPARRVSVMSSFSQFIVIGSAHVEVRDPLGILETKLSFETKSKKRLCVPARPACRALQGAD